MRKCLNNDSPLHSHSSHAVYRKKNVRHMRSDTGKTSQLTTQWTCILSISHPLAAGQVGNGKHQNRAHLMRECSCQTRSAFNCRLLGLPRFATTTMLRTGWVFLKIHGESVGRASGSRKQMKIKLKLEVRGGIGGHRQRWKMGWTLLGYAVACFVLAVHASPVVDNGDDRKGFRYEEYQIEHEVSSAQAKNSAQAIDLSRGKKVTW